MQRPTAAALAGLMLLAACSDEEPTRDAGPPADAPSPERIVSMVPSATEMLFAIGAGDQVVAVDDQSNFPESAPMTDLSAYEPNVEAIAAEDPDLVVVSDETLEGELDELGIAVHLTPDAKEIDDVYEQITGLGEVTGHEDQAAEVVEEMQAEIEELQGEVPERAEPLTYYHELDDTLYSVTSDTFIGALYELAGLENVADPADAQGQSGGYPQLSSEALVAADPDLVFLADTKCCAQTADTLAARPGFDQLTAVREGRVTLLDDDIASRWGPRIVDFFRIIVETVRAVPAA